MVNHNDAGTGISNISLEAMMMLTSAWEEVKTETIANYFNKCGEDNALYFDENIALISMKKSHCSVMKTLYCIAMKYCSVMKTLY